MNIPSKLIDFLNQNQVRYEVIHHPEAFTAQELAAIEHVKGKQHAKVVMVKSNGDLLMTVLPADHRIDLEKLDRLTGHPTSLAAEPDFKDKFPDCATGAMPPFGHLYNVRTLMDQSLADDDTIVFEAGTHTDAIKMRGKDFARIARSELADFAVKMH
jgi:Ala-tRNA(Pro) deacylase